jgi:hypothetical protein
MKAADFFLVRLLRLTGALSAVAGAMLLAGCTHTTRVRVAPTARIASPAGGKIPMHVALMLRGPYTNYTHKISRMGDTWLTPLGPALRQGAVSLCEQTFQQVTVSTNGVVPAGVDGVLTPDLHRAACAWSTGRKLMFTLLVEWTLRNPQNDHTLWVATVDGQGTDREKKVFQKLFDDLVANSHAAFHGSPEIKRLAGRAN